MNFKMQLHPVAISQSQSSSKIVKQQSAVALPEEPCLFLMIISPGIGTRSEITKPVVPCVFLAPHEFF